MKYIFIILLTILLAGCSLNNIERSSDMSDKKTLVKIDDNKTCRESLKSRVGKGVEIYDLLNIPQDATFFTKYIDNNSSLYDIQKKYEENYFSIWNIDKPIEDLNSAKWPFDSFCAGNSYGENLQLIEQSFFDKMIENANFENYATVNLKGVLLKISNLRAFPTIKPLLRDPSLAGEGFPFDYLQNSTVHANKPIFVSHYSKDREWAFVVSSFASGWVKSDEFVILKKKYTDNWQKAQQVTIIKEDEPIYDVDGNFLFKSKIGMMFALVSEQEDTYTILTVSSYKNSKPLFLKSKVSKKIATKEILKLNQENIAKIVNEISKTNYGWGGMYEQRDCSSMLRDMFAPFGIWLPRNSYQQSKVGKIVSLENLTDDEKIKTIKEKAVAFQTLLYKKGHIVLYVGTYNDEIVIFHNTWGIKTKKDLNEGRVIIGKAIFSSLKLGRYQDDYDKDGEILKNLISMNIITQ